ncbi:unnamed protein product [Miscanthus lutarioriparius]|uniref:Cytochrome P450 n=1 Tax=Miscanthus lutarioriparius TaxID=422564 RepID=A0A811N239_9POAL|nr:unnamed protein product [Miscanthus lutarioriparius]
MASDHEDSLLLLLLPTTSPLPTLLAVFLLATVLLWLSPGGPAWALSSPVAHCTLAALSSAADGGKALIAFSVGLTRFVVSSHPDTAREILTSPTFGDRPVKDAARHLLFHRAMGFAPSGDAHWRGLRRRAAAHLFVQRRVAGAAHHRVSIGEAMLSDVSADMARHGEVSLRRLLHAASLNHIMATVFGKRYDLARPEGVLLDEMVTEGYDLLGTFNWADHLPLIKFLDLQGVPPVQREHRARRANGGVDDDEFLADFVDVLLDLEGEEKLSDSDMIAVLWEMIFRGADTVAILMEWIMTRMALHPDIQAKAQSELDAVVGTRSIADDDVVNLPYVQSIVKETLRMHAPGPLLSWARLAIHDAHVGAHLVPAGTTAMVNMWAIAHDPAVWAEPEEFRPERFQEEEDVSVLGSDLRLAPFGAGRRVCPGKMLALATTHLWVAQLLHRFEWAPAAAGGGVDLSERLNMSLEMASPLVCKAVPRSQQA